MRLALGLLAAAVAALGVGWVLFVTAPDWLATHDVGDVGGALRAARLLTDWEGA
jgi:hypothetical protein